MASLSASASPQVSVSDPWGSRRADHVQVVDKDFVRSGSSEPPRVIGHLVPGNRHQPGNELAARIVGRHRPMQGKQHLLHEVVPIG